jgi:hypothetical protein
MRKVIGQDYGSGIDRTCQAAASRFVTAGFEHAALIA